MTGSIIITDPARIATVRSVPCSPSALALFVGHFFFTSMSIVQALLRTCVVVTGNAGRK